MGLVVFLILIGAAGLYWYGSLQAQERATRAAVETCRRQGLQFLDGTVALSRLRVRRRAGGQLGFERTYRFEYSEDSANRRAGFVIMMGAAVDTVGLAAPPAAAPGWH